MLRPGRAREERGQTQGQTKPRDGVFLRRPSGAHGIPFVTRGLRSQTRLPPAIIRRPSGTKSCSLPRGPPDLTRRRPGPLLLRASGGEGGPKRIADHHFYIFFPFLLPPGPACNTPR